MGKICGFTGYRPEKLPYGSNERHPDCLRLKEELLRQAVRAAKDGMTHFICGGALGSDTYAAEAVLILQKECPGLILEIAVPFIGQERKWRREDQVRYHAILDSAQRITYLSDSPTIENFYKRNRYIVDRASRLVAVFDGKRGGTMQTVRYAQKCGREIVRISPDGILL